MEHLLQSADRALYTAKQNGRDRTEYLPLPEGLQA
jgi:PleD family two-component response regulator